MQTILITWASWWIWSELAKLAKENGYEVIGSYFENDAIAKVMEENYKIPMYQLDLSDESSIDIFVAKLNADKRNIDFLINNAATMIRDQNIESQSFDEIQYQIDTNLVWPLYLTSSLVYKITSWIINISTKLIKQPKIGSTPYIVSKAGMELFTKTLALEYPELDSFTVCPRKTNTQMGDYEGDDPKLVAKIILDVLKKNIQVENGGTVMVADHIKKEMT